MRIKRQNNNVREFVFKEHYVPGYYRMKYQSSIDYFNSTLWVSKILLSGNSYFDSPLKKKVKINKRCYFFIKI